MVTSKVLGEVRHGTRGGRPDARLLGGWFVFDSPDSALLVSLLPSLVHVRGVERLSILVRLVGEEASERRAGRDLVLTRLVEVLLIEALRAAPGDDAPPGLLRGLADARLAPAIRQMHSQLGRSWMVALLAKTATQEEDHQQARHHQVVEVGLQQVLVVRKQSFHDADDRTPARHHASTRVIMASNRTDRTRLVSSSATSTRSAWAAMSPCRPFASARGLNQILVRAPPG